MSLETSTHSVECIAVIGKNNNPLYVKNFTNRPDLDLHYFVYISLDAIEERLADARQNTDLYLGMIFFMESLNVYALCTASRIKLVVVVRWNGMPPKETAVRTLLGNVYKSYAALSNNPFYTVDAEITGAQCRAFEQTILQCTL